MIFHSSICFLPFPSIPSYQPMNVKKRVGHCNCKVHSALGTLGVCCGYWKESAAFLFSPHPVNASQNFSIYIS